MATSWAKQLAGLLLACCLAPLAAPAAAGHASPQLRGAAATAGMGPHGDAAQLTQQAQQPQQAQQGPEGGAAASGLERGRGKEWRRHCGGLDCPRYTVCSATEEFEVRKYEHVLWAVTTVQAVNFRKAMRKGAERLAAYFHGSNENSTKMELTLPLLVSHRPSPHPHPWEHRPYKIALPLPHKYQHQAPTPSSPDVFLVLYNPRPHVFAAAFHRRATDRRVLHHARHLWAALDAAGADYLEGEVLVASFNCPWNRGRKQRHARRWHTEVWANGNWTAGVVGSPSSVAMV